MSTPQQLSSPAKGSKLSNSHSTNKPHISAWRSEHRKEMKGKFIKISLEEFFARFLALDENARKKAAASQPPGYADVFKEPLAKLKKYKEKTRRERHLQMAFIRGVNETKSSAGRRLCPGYKLVGTQDTPGTEGITKQRVDACMFSKRGNDKVTDNAQHWDLQKCHIEFKDTDCDPFDDNAKDSDSFDASTSQARKETRGQIISYAAQVFIHQHRCFFFSVLVLGRSARIIRWDRAGAIVTTKFDYGRRPELAEFLRRFALLRPEQQGFDPSATLVTKGSKEWALMEKMKDEVEDTAVKDDQGQSKDGDDSNYEYARKLFAKSLAGGCPRWKLAVRDETARDNLNGQADTGDSSTSPSKSVKAPLRYFLVGRARFYAEGMAGRGTRGFVAIEWNASGSSRSFFYLKDAWRVIQIEKEGDILSNLHAAHVRFIPTLVCHGDVPKQKTITDKEASLTDEQETFTDKYWSTVHPNDPENPLRSHRHYRMVVEEVGRPLDDVENSHQLLFIIDECLCAHEDAWEKLQVLHRDISRGNMLMVRGDDGLMHGLLIDWELSRSFNKDTNARQSHRTGTWQFMSARLLKNPDQGSILQDDLESFLHVLLYISVRFFKHNCSKVDKFMTDFFDAGEPANGDTWIVGKAKWNAMINGDFELSEPGGAAVLRFDSMGPNPHPLNTILEYLMTLFKAHYTVLREEAKAVKLTNEASSAEQRRPTGHGAQMKKAYAASSKKTGYPNEDKATIVIPKTTTGTASALSLGGSSGEVLAPAELAANLKTHRPLRMYIRSHIDQYDSWPDDKVGDQLSPDYRRRNAGQLGPDAGSKRGSDAIETEELRSTGSKRPKMSKPEEIESSRILRATKEIDYNEDTPSEESSVYEEKSDSDSSF